MPKLLAALGWPLDGSAKRRPQLRATLFALCLFAVTTWLYLGDARTRSDIAMHDSLGKLTGYAIQEAFEDLLQNQLSPGGMEQLWLTADNVTTRSEDNGLPVYRMSGRNYGIGPSRLKRLHRLPRYEHLFAYNATHTHRFSLNPSLAPHVSLPNTFVLSLETRGTAIFRDTAGVTWLPDTYLQTIQTLALMRINKRAEDDFTIDVEKPLIVQPSHGFDTRLLPMPGYSKLLMYSAYGQNGIFELDPYILTIRAAAYLSYDDPIGTDNKNWQAVFSGERLLWLAHFCPFILLDCGPLTASGPDGFLPGKSRCDVHVQKAAPKILQAQNCTEWRGSHAYVPIPASTAFAVSTVHEKVEEQTADYRGRRVFYQRRFVMIDTLTLAPVAFTPPFAIFGKIKDLDWYEFATGGAFVGPCNFALTFGYNDQEPWLAMINFADILPFFQAVHETDSLMLREFIGTYRQSHVC